MKAVDDLAAGFLMRVDAAAQNLETRGNRDVQVGRETVGRVTTDRKPPRGIQQESVVGMYGCEFDAINRGVFVAAQAPFIGELHRDRLSLYGRRIEAEAYGR